MPAPLTLVPSDPTQDQRTRRFEQVVREILNGLILKGVITQGGGSTSSWGLSNLLFTGTGNPASTLGWKNDYYLDLSSGALWQNQ